MTGLAINETEFASMRQLLAELCGITVAENKAYLIETRLGSLVLESGCGTFSEFHQKLKYGGDLKLRDRVVDLMTTNETLWFRDGHPFRILEEVLLPEYARQQSEGRRQGLRIWSAACSTGQEPYSIAMVLREAMRRHAELGRLRVEILASDISVSALRLAKLGQYEPLAINRGLPEHYRERYFTNQGRVWSIAPQIREMVTLKKVNLQDSFAALGRFDVILCRNVAIYFSDVFKRDLFSRFAAALYPDGVFFMGASESLSNYCGAFRMERAAGGVYYRLGDVTKGSLG